jgi:predicted O-methyltransferase YrrM
MFDDVTRYASRFDELSESTGNPVGFTFANSFFSSPDAEVLYCMIRRYRPRKIVEIGSGSSTKISRLALMDGGIDAQLVSVDPQPRADIDDIADKIYREAVERIDDLSLFSDLEENDVLFIDSSHELRVGNDLTHIYLKAIPILASGVLVHIHDIFLPYDYRPGWVLKQRRHYTEQYIVQAMLQSDGMFRAIWPGYYFQRTDPAFSSKFPHRQQRDAQSLWLRKC